MAQTPYLLGGALMWFQMLQSWVHATISGVLLAYAIPFFARSEDESSPSHRQEHTLHMPVAFVILPVVALANTGLAIASGWQQILLAGNTDVVNASKVAILLASTAAGSVGFAGLRWVPVARQIGR